MKNALTTMAVVIIGSVAGAGLAQAALNQCCSEDYTECYGCIKSGGGYIHMLGMGSTCQTAPVEYFECTEDMPLTVCFYCSDNPADMWPPCDDFQDEFCNTPWNVATRLVYQIDQCDSAVNLPCD